MDGLGVGGSAVGPSFFYEDEVFKVNKNGDVEFGMVTENWDMYSTDEVKSYSVFTHENKEKCLLIAFFVG